MKHFVMDITDKDGGLKTLRQGHRKDGGLKTLRRGCQKDGGLKTFCQGLHKDRERVNTFGVAKTNNSFSPFILLFCDSAFSPFQKIGN